MPDLITMRLADMQRVHPQMIVKTCDRCKEKVGIYPSGQRAIAAGKVEHVVCHVCAKPIDYDWTILAPGAEREPFESVPVSRETSGS